jgi:quinoprotein glucose dehydrogenase
MIRSHCVAALLALSAAGGLAEEIKDTPMPLKAVRVMPELRIRRPLVVTHAGDGSHRLFVASQYGVVHVLAGDQPSPTEAPVFLDIETRVVYKDKENEEGLLGLAFHPKFSQNGQFFVYYTTTSAPHTSVVSRFHLLPNSNRADPNSELELMRIQQPFWNHNGGGLAFGPDGYLYIALGDGGAANDPMGNGQNLSTLLGSILRIDVDREDSGRKYGIPKDNPFVNHERARSEIWAYGLRNVWGMSFDRETGTFWAADVGQDLWEEIDLIVKGGNYGWNLREGKHKFKNGADPRPDLIEPIWEYHHDVGKSITGGMVYRGKKFPELVGCYLYADYITGKLWALRYDFAQQKVLANYMLQDFNHAPIICFGTDESNEVYFTDTFGQIFQLARASEE